MSNSYDEGWRERMRFMMNEVKQKFGPRSVKIIPIHFEYTPIVLTNRQTIVMVRCMHCGVRAYIPLYSLLQRDIFATCHVCQKEIRARA